MIQAFRHHHPRFGKGVRIHETAVVIGRVWLDDEVSLWPGAVLRGDLDDILIGPRTNIQDHCVLHMDQGLPTRVGEDCVIGHQACLHGCTVGNRCLIGIHATVLNGAIIGDECIIGAGTLIPEGKVIPPRSLVVGLPGRAIREVTDDELRHVLNGAKEYLEMAKSELPLV